MMAAYRTQHRMTIHYPCAALRNEVADYQYGSIVPPVFAHERYKPGQVTASPSAAQHTTRFHDGSKVNSLVSARIPTPYQLESFRLADPEMFDSHVDHLFHNLEQVTQWTGETALMILTYMSTQGAHQMIILRSTTLQGREGAQKQTKTIYVVGVDEFMRMCDIRSHEDTVPIWLTHLVDAFLQESDHAVIAYEDSRRTNGIPAIAFDWVERPLHNWGILLPGLTHSPASVDKDAACPVCFEPYDDLARKPVHLSCSPHHILCFQCLTNHCQVQGDEASCPHCRTEIMNDPKWLKYLQEGLDHNGVYRADDRFSEWENHERSCADLDEKLAKTESHPVLVDSLLIMEIVDHMFERARTEEYSSTPLGMRPGEYPEMACAYAAIEELSSRLSGSTVPTSTLWQLMIREVKQYLTTDFVKSETASLRSAESLNVVAFGHELLFTVVIQPPGLMHFVEILLNRTLRFLHLRHCDCVDAGLHSHGGRLYYGNDAAHHDPQLVQNEEGEEEAVNEEGEGEEDADEKDFTVIVQ